MIKDNSSEKFVRDLLQQEYVNRYFNKLQKHHNESSEHCLRVSALAVYLGHKNCVSDSDLRTLGISGLLHDIGKCDVSDRILSKNSMLNNKEKEIVQQHPRFSFLHTKDNVFERVKKIIVGHHEYKIDPYPRNNKERRSTTRDYTERRNGDEQISLLTEILAVADIFDALISKRSYKESFSKNEVGKIMSKQFVGNQKLIGQILLKY